MKFTDEEIKQEYHDRPEDCARILAIRKQIREGGSIYENNDKKPDENRDILVKYQYVRSTWDSFETGLFYAREDGLVHTSGDRFSNLNYSFVAVDWKYADDCFA